MNHKNGVSDKATGSVFAHQGNIKSFSDTDIVTKLTLSLDQLNMLQNISNMQQGFQTHSQHDSIMIRFMVEAEILSQKLCVT